MIAYFDTSALVPLFLDEPLTSAAWQLWDEAERSVSSLLVRVEARAALARAVRTGRLEVDDLARALDAFERLAEELFLMDVTPGLIDHAAGVADQEGLLAYDAVHLASAELLDIEDVVLVTGDRLLADAAGRRGLAAADFTR